MKRVILVSLFLFTNLWCCAQQLIFFRPGNLAKLPSSESYNVMQDSRGYIWISTEAGLCRYNGNKIKVYGKQQGLPEGSTYQVFEDVHQRIWMITSRNRILQYDREKDSLVELSFSKTYASALKTQLDQAYLAQIEGDSVLWVSSQVSTYKINIHTGACKLIVGDSTDYSFLHRDGRLIHVKTRFELSRTAAIMNSKFTTLSITDNTTKKILKIKRDGYRLPVSRLLTVMNKKKENFISYDNTLIKLQSDLSYEAIHGDAVILGIYVDKDDGLWLARAKGGLVYYPHSIISDSLKISGLSGLSVTGVCEDQEGGIWCTTLEKGVFYCRNKKVVSFTNISGLDQRAEFLKTEAGRLFASSEKNELIWTAGSIFHKVGFSNSINSGLSDIVPYRNGWLISGKREVLLTDASFTHPTSIKTPNNLLPGVNQMAQNGNKVYGIQFGAFVEIEGKRCRILINPLKYPGHCILFTRSKELFIGSKSGLIKIDTSTFKETKVEEVQGSVTKLAENKDGLTWILTRDNGLYTMSKGHFKKLSDSLKLPAASLFDIAFDSYGNVWLATNMGIIRLRNKTEVAVLNMSSGILSEEVTSVAVLNDILYASTREGLCAFSVSAELINNAPPPIFIGSIRINDSLVSLKDDARLPYNHNNITVTADVLTYKQFFEPARMFYLLMGQDKNIHYVDGHELVLNNLSPGYYKLFLYALNNDNEPSAKPIRLSFTIMKPFWQRTLFLIGAFLIIISIIGLGVTSLLRRIRKKEEEKTRINTLIAQYHMSALRAQMNPHFIFNCINSIQRFVITNRAEEAYDYLAKFSKLIRLVLNYAEENFISLEQELELIRLYLALEQMRVDNKFTWSIDRAEEVKANELEVPVMMLQPYVENAIWHGVMNLPKNKKGHIGIKVRTSMKEKLLEVVIEDNGIGRERAAQLAANNHRSKATGINQKRSEMMNILSGSNSGRIEVDDLVDADHCPAGTRVKIFISQKTETHEYS